jgi:8-oxo-dGTP pyrophosphatase MutT (NUDIX family)
MPNYVYCVLYDSDRKFLIATKRSKGYFFCSNGSIVPAGQRLNGGGKPALPGGARAPGEDIRDGAIREFREETRVEIQGAEHEWSHNWGRYAAGYFRVSPAALAGIQTTVNTNLGAGNQAALAVEGGQIQDCDALHRTFPLAPDDNELQVVDIWDLNDHTTWNRIQTWDGDRDLGWFYDILDHLRSNTQA